MSPDRPPPETLREDAARPDRDLPLGHWDEPMEDRYPVWRRNLYWLIATLFSAAVWWAIFWGVRSVLTPQPLEQRRGAVTRSHAVPPADRRAPEGCARPVSPDGACAPRVGPGAGPT